MLIWLLLVIFCLGVGTETLVKCNLDESSNVLLHCRSDHRISVELVKYIDSCGETGNCSKSTGREDLDFKLACQGQYGKCLQPLNYTILDSCKGSKSVSAEITYTCEKNQNLPDSDEPTTDTQFGSNNTTWKTNMFCPNKSIVYIDSVQYFKRVKDVSCPGAGGLLPVKIPSEPNRLNDLCIEQQECHPSLLYNITHEGCQYTWPTMGANVVYRCITNELLYSVCSKSVRTINNSLSTLYMTSPSSSSHNTSDCGCLVYGDIQTVKILYIKQSTINSTRDRLSFNPPTTVELNTNTIIYRDIKDLVVKYNDINHNNEKHLLEFKARSGSFLQLDCINKHLKPTSSRLTGTTDVNLTRKTTLANTTTEITTSNPTTNGHANTPVNLATETTLANTTTATTITNTMRVTTTANPTTNGHANTTANLGSGTTLANTRTGTTITTPMGVTATANPTTNGRAKTTVNLASETTFANTTTATTITNTMRVTTTANPTTNEHVSTTITKQQTIITHSESGTQISNSVPQNTFAGITIGTSVPQSPVQQTEDSFTSSVDTTKSEDGHGVIIVLAVLFTLCLISLVVLGITAFILCRKGVLVLKIKQETTMRQLAIPLQSEQNVESAYESLDSHTPDPPTYTQLSPYINIDADSL